ncbi:formate/nitrite transporter family protein [Azospirillum halopraeferens]|uniref:formate/nitrite transporter family protein n=1 Tax=Azospirillum halopraeferens TaxID=34010 RepID=UPI00040452F9|nr:formate/nitrite transporter family protein [Azospirillum halopraeferens]
MDPQTPDSSPDPLSPEAVALKAEDMALKKAHRDTAGLLALAVLAGAYIALGALFSTVAMSGGDALPYGVTRLLGGLTFSLGLVLVMVGGAQLFTGDALMVMAWASHRLRVSEMVRVWCLVWVGNFIGAAGTALLVFLSGQYGFGHAEVGRTALYIAHSKTALPPVNAFFLGILCNVLVCLAVWMTLGARSVTDKVVAMALPVTAFAAAGFEHSIANMYFIPLGALIEWGAPESFWAALGTAGPDPDSTVTLANFALRLALVTLGNWVGGALFVGGMVWFAFRRPPAPQVRPAGWASAEMEGTRIK